jgi:antitoxin StbD
MTFQMQPQPTPSISIEQLQSSYEAVLQQAKEQPVAVFNGQQLQSYLVPASYYAAILQRIEDLEDSLLVHERGSGPFIEVNPNGC